MRNKLFTFVMTFVASAGLFTSQAQQTVTPIELGGSIYVAINGEAYEVAENLIPNGSFEEGVSGWMSGTKGELGSGFTVNEDGGVDNGSYIVATASTGKTGAGSIGAAWPLEAGERYYFSYSIKSIGGATETSYLVTTLDNTIVGNEPLKLWGKTDGGGTTPLLGNVVVTEDGEWCRNAAVFTNTEEYQYLCCNFRWMGGQWGFDDFNLGKLIPAENLDAFEIYEIMLDQKRIEVDEYSKSKDLMDLLGLKEELEEAFLETFNADENTVEGIQAELLRLEAVLQKTKNGIVLSSELESLLAECRELLNWEYPGLEEFEAVCSAAQNVIANSAQSVYADYENGIKDLEEARIIYYYSQIASVDNPANYTFFIDGPSFWNPKCGLTYEELTEGNRNTWQAVDSWVNASVSNSGSFAANHYGGRPCWNSWSTTHTSMDVHQVLADLPNGYYAIKCYAMTQEGCINDQHAYVKGTAGVAKSTVMTIDGLWDTPSGWEELTTDKIAVIDGKLTIGFASTKDPLKTEGAASDGRNGRFCVTDFTLLYYGEIEIGLMEILNARVAEAQKVTVSLNGDRKALDEALAIAAKATTDKEIIAALDSINISIDLANASNAAYNKFMATNLENAKNEAEYLTGVSKDIMDAIIDRTIAYTASPVALFAQLNEVYAPALSYYKSYVNVLPDAELIVATPPAGYLENSVIDLENTMINQQELLIGNLITKSTVDWYIQNINNGIKAIKSGVYVQAAKIAGSDYDMSGLIINADAAAKDGWVWLNLTDGPIKTGQYYDDEHPDHKYFDSWNGTAGKLKLTAFQEIEFLPNGNYTLKVAARSSCENGGAMLFVSAKDIASNDTLWQSIIGDSNTGGNIWKAAMDSNPESGMAIVNNGEGRGWNWHEFIFDVVDHKISIGMSTDSIITHVPFTGTWFSAVNFQLIMNAYGDDNDEYFGWVTGVEDINIVEEPQIIIRAEGKKIYVTNVNGEPASNYKVYSVIGTEVNPVAEQRTGIYIVKVGRQVTKVVIK